MIVSVVLNTEYMDIASRTKWYLKNLLHCKDNGWVLITHEYMKVHFAELQKEVTPSLFESWEIRPFTMEEINDVEQYFIPDSVFEEMQKNCGSRTEMLSKLFESYEDALYTELTRIFTEISTRHQTETIDAVLHILEPFESLKQVARDFNCRLINYSFSAIRKPHGYKMTFYNVNETTYWDGGDARIRYERFINNYDGNIFFTNEELIAIVGKDRTLPEIILMDFEPKYEMGVFCECFSLVPASFIRHRFTDDDIFYECKKIFGSKNLKVRSHSLHLDDLQVDRSTVHNDPASTILSCKRCTAVQSQILLKCLLWKRPVTLANDTLSFSFMCNKDVASLKRADIKSLNFYLFAYLIPDKLMFNDEYWKWRFTCPSEAEIYEKHINYIFSELGIPDDVLKENIIADRYKLILKSRNVDKQLMEMLLSNVSEFQVNWDVLISRFEIISSEGEKIKYWRLTKMSDDGTLYTCFDLENTNICAVDFFPLDDVAGFTSIKEIIVNGVPKECIGEYMYMPKGSGKYSISLDEISQKINIQITWQFKSNLN